MTSLTPKVFVVGAGPVATALAGGLRLAGVPVLGLWARRPGAARTAATVSGVASFSAAPPDLLLEADVLLIAVRDGAISTVAEMLVGTGFVTRRHVLLHCSGAVSASEAFSSVRTQVAGVGTLHPLRAIPHGASAMRNLGKTVFGVEGDDMGRGAAMALAAALGGHPLALEGEQMAAYHTAAAMASNYAVALLDGAVELLKKSGIPEPEALTALLPLMEGSLANLRESSTREGLTGPIRRGDHLTIARHLSAIERLCPQLLPLYRVMGQRTLAIARATEGVDPASLESVGRLLESPGSCP